MPSIYVRQAQSTDLDAMLAIIEAAKKLLAADGIDQWQDGYPDRKQILTDIDNHYAYLLIVDHQIAGTATLLQTPDPNYQEIYQGSWQRPEDTHYVSIHRIAIAAGFHGLHLADFFFSNLYSVAKGLGFNQVRIDTHAINQRMQHIIQKNGFTYQGVVYMHHDDQAKRNAYQLFLN